MNYSGVSVLTSVMRPANKRVTQMVVTILTMLSLHSGQSYIILMHIVPVTPLPCTHTHTHMHTHTHTQPHTHTHIDFTQCIFPCGHDYCLTLASMLQLLLTPPHTMRTALSIVLCRFQIVNISFKAVTGKH